MAVAGAWARQDGRGLAWLAPVASSITSAVDVPADALALLRAARSAVVVLGVDGWAARFVSGRDLRAALGTADRIVVSADNALEATCGGVALRLTTRPNHRA